MLSENFIEHAVDHQCCNIFTLIILIVIVLLLLLVHFCRLREQNLPPGPFCLPLVGYLPFLGSVPHDTFRKLKRKYGNVVSLYLGGRFVIVLGDFSSVKEAFMKDAFLGRPPNPPNHVIQGTISISASSGHAWKEQRKFAFHVFRNLGYGKYEMEDSVKMEIGYFLKELEKFKGEPCNVRRYLLPSISNNISALLLGRRMEYNDPKRILLDKVVDDIVRYLKPTGYHAFFPRLKSFFFQYEILGYKNLNDTVKKMLEFVDEEIQYHQKTLIENDIRDYIDGFLIEMEKRKKFENNSFRLPMLRGNIPALFGAGGFTVRATMEWALLTMAAYPDVQKRVQKEIDDIIGKERHPSWTDRANMPYTQSVIMEIQRWKTVNPLNLVRYCAEDSTVQGFNIPKDTVVFANMWEVHHDPDYWEKPDEFIDDRFLSKDGQSIIKHQCFMPFAIGKRACPGESMALMEIFLYLTSILQKFCLLPEEDNPVSFEASIGVINEPVSCNLRVSPRI